MQSRSTPGALGRSQQGTLSVWGERVRPGINRRHKLDLSVYQLPPLPFFTGSQELLPGHSGLCCHDSLTGWTLSRLDSARLLFEPHFSIPAISVQPHDNDRSLFWLLVLGLSSLEDRDVGVSVFPQGWVTSP